LRQVFAFAAHEDREYLDGQNPADGLRITSKKRRQKPKPDPYTAEDRDTLLQWLKANGKRRVIPSLSAR
jgi:hypothetical protein